MTGFDDRKEKDLAKDHSIATENDTAFASGFRDEVSNANSETAELLANQEAYTESVPLDLPSSNPEQENGPEQSLLANADLYASHMILEGETLFSIAKNYLGDGNRWEEIKQANEIKDETDIDVGTKIILPIQICDEHFIREGDTYWSLARERLDDPKLWPIIEQFNPELDKDDLDIGQRILVPRQPEKYLFQTPQTNEAEAEQEILVENVESEEITEPPITEAEEQELPVLKRNVVKNEVNPVQANPIYIVQSGDILSSIAEKFLGKASRWQEIEALNKAVDPSFKADKLNVGNRLQMPEEAADAIYAIQGKPDPELQINSLDKIRNGEMVLRYGMSGPGVQQIQDYLNKLNLNITSLKVDGAFGGKTADVVRYFQWHYNQYYLQENETPLKIDSRIGKNTLEALEQVINGERAARSEPLYTREYSRTLPPDSVLKQYVVKGHLQPTEGIVDWSRMKIPIDQSPGRLSGYSRAWGGADAGVQVEVMKLTLEKFADYPIEDQAIALAIVCHESGFNPDAATPSSSAGGPFQILIKTGESLGIYHNQVFDAERNIQGGIDLYEEYSRNSHVLSSVGQERCWRVYNVHHDGPTPKAAGEFLGKTHVVPLYHEFLAMLKTWQSGQGYRS